MLELWIEFVIYFYKLKMTLRTHFFCVKGIHLSQTRDCTGCIIILYVCIVGLYVAHVH